MDTTWLDFFLCFVSVTVIVNTALIISMYKAFASVTLKTTELTRQFKADGETREWIESVRQLSEQAVAVTEMTKQKLVDLDPALEKVQARFGFTLATIDAKVEKFTDSVSENTQRFSDAVKGPVEKFSNFSSGIQSALESVMPNGNQE